jgi:predicted DNA-binding transcriptional regulator YafY
MSNPKAEATIDYTNWRGERSIRRIRPLHVAFENNEWHPETQWLLYAVDVLKGEERTFAIRNIHAWLPSDQVTPAIIAEWNSHGNRVDWTGTNP